MMGALAARGRPRALHSTAQRMPQDTSALGTAAARPRSAGLLGGAGPALSLDGGSSATPAAPGSARAELAGALGGPVQARLAVQPAGDSFEREADAASEDVLAGRQVGGVSRLAASPGKCPACAAAEAQGVQRKCATCAQRDSDAGAPGVSAGVASGRTEHAMAGAGNGSPLNPDTRRTMEQRFGADFGGVRVHRGPAADEANRALGARAFTRGSDVYLGRGASPDDPELIAHELTHVVQQSTGDVGAVQRQPAPGGDDPALAAQLADQIQATEESARLANPEDRAFFIRTALLLKNTHDPLKTQEELDAFIHGAAFEAEQEWETLEELGDNAEDAMKSNPEVFPRHWAKRIKDALAIGVDVQAVKDELQATLQQLQTLAKGLPDAIIAEGLPVPFGDRGRLPTFRLRRQDAQSSGAVAEYARAGIRYSQIRSLAVFAETWQRGLGETVQEIEDGTLVVDYAAWENFSSGKTLKLRLLPQRARTDLATDDDQAQQFDADMDDIVDAAGPLAAISMLSGLLYGSFDGWDYAFHGFTEQLGTANEIVAGGASDGRVSRQPLYVSLHTAMQLIPGAGIFGDSDNLGRMALGLTWGWEQGYLGAATIEALDDLMSHILTFLIETTAFLAAQEVPGLNILVDIFAGYQMLELIDSFLSAYNAAADARRVGPLQHAGSRLLELIASTAVQAAAGAVVSAGFHGVRGIGKGAKDEPRVPGEEPGPAEPTAPARSSGGSKGGTGVGGTAKGVLEENALAKKPVEGHEVVVTEEGVGICSPDPCPVIGVEYAQELADHPNLKEWNDQVQELRKTDPIRAADEAAGLVRTAEAARANAARAARAAGEEPIFTLGVGKDRMERIRTGERDFVVDRRMTFDIDEVLPVGESGIKPQRAVDRAMSAENRQLLDPNTNQRTKGLGIDPRELPANRTPRQPVSVTTNPHALLTHRFSEIPELQRIFDRAVESVKNKGELRPTELKARINAETRRIITEDMGADAVAVRQALTDLGFVRQPNVGWVMTTGGMPQRPPPTSQ